MKILIAEDERITRRSLQRSLESWGHSVDVAEDGLVAWSLLQEQPFDAVLTDWQMPGLNGVELVERIRARDAGGYVYVILLTSKSHTDDLVSTLERGADDFLTKPFEQNELRARLNAGERVIRLERTLAEQNAQMTRDLHGAANYVRSLIPAPRNEPEIIDWRYVPAQDLAGDSLGYHEIDDEHLGIYLLDVTGHGIDAALLSVTILNVVMSMSLPVDFRKPDQVLQKLNDNFPMEKHEDRCFSMWYGVLHRPTRNLRWAGGGHPATLLLNGDDAPQVEYLPSTGPLVGMMPEMEFPSSSIQLAPSARLLLYSDGVYEIETPEGELWGQQAFVDFVTQRHPSNSDFKDALYETILKMSGTAQLEDDFTILDVRL